MNDVTVSVYWCDWRTGDRKLFTHFIYWGNFVVSGQSAGVHPVELSTVDITDAQKAAEIVDDRKMSKCIFIHPR